MKGLMAMIIGWPWGLQLLVGWVVGIAGLAVVSALFALLWRVGVLSAERGGLGIWAQVLRFCLLYAPVPPAVALMESGTFALLGRWSGPWIATAIALPLAGAQGLALLYVAPLIHGFAYLCLGPPI